MHQQRWAKARVHHLLSVGCLCPSKVFESPALVRARYSVNKAQNYSAREKMWLQRETVAKIVDWCEQRPAYRSHGYLYLLSYIFLLRLPSEGLPATGGKANGTSPLYKEGDSLVLELQRR